MLQRYPDARVDDIRWETLLPEFISLKYWISRKHQPCPVCGGRDRFRLFHDWRKTGGAICNRCDAGNGWTWIQRVTGRFFKEDENMATTILRLPALKVEGQVVVMTPGSGGRHTYRNDSGLQHPIGIKPCMKLVIVELGLRALLSHGLATWLIQKGGLRNE